jgi:murein DD-endopeptidase MepM/ murein hydrolase activator NlpD
LPCCTYQQIGLVGSSSFSTGPHIRFEAALDRHPVNPAVDLKVMREVYVLI